MILLFALVILAAPAAAQSRDDDHAPSVLGIEIGMNAGQVLEKLNGRMPDGRKDEKDKIIVQWKLEDGSALRVTFYKDGVSDVFVQYRNPRATTDLNLAQQFSSASRTALTASDPRLRRDYKATQTDDQRRTVWSREDKSSSGFRVQIRFLSASRKQFGDLFEDKVEFKYVSLAKEDVKKFEAAMAAAAKQ